MRDVDVVGELLLVELKSNDWFICGKVGEFSVVVDDEELELDFCKTCRGLFEFASSVLVLVLALLVLVVGAVVVLVLVICRVKLLPACLREHVGSTEDCVDSEEESSPVKRCSLSL